MKHKAVRFVVKWGISLAVSAAIGYVIKGEQKLTDMIDKKWPDVPSTLNP